MLEPPYDPYIGIDDFTSGDQVRAMQTVFERHRPADSKRVLHAGVMMSRKTLLGLPSKFAAIFPPKESIAEIFSAAGVYNCLHYADYARGGKDEDFVRNLCNAIGYCGVNLDAIQLDMVWPEPNDVWQAVHASRKTIEVILQVGLDAFDQIQDDPDTLAERLGEYKGVVDRVLLDKSMGKGRIMDAPALLPFAHAIKKKLPDMALAIAGGLGPKTLHYAKPFLDVFPETSIDACGRLRASGSNLDPISWSMAEEYLIMALQDFW